MPSLYELTNEYKSIYEQMSEPDTDEDSFQAMLALIADDIHIKAENYAKIIKSAESDVAAYKVEIDRLSDKKKNTENHIKRMKETLQQAMEITGEKKFDSGVFSFNIQKNPASCEFEVDEELIPEKYRIPQPDKIDKKAIIADLKDEEKAEGLKGIAHLIQGESLRIK